MDNQDNSIFLIGLNYTTVDNKVILDRILTLLSRSNGKNPYIDGKIISGTIDIEVVRDTPKDEDIVKVTNKKYKHEVTYNSTYKRIMLQSDRNNIFTDLQFLSEIITKDLWILQYDSINNTALYMYGVVFNKLKYINRENQFSVVGRFGKVITYNIDLSSGSITIIDNGIDMVNLSKLIQMDINTTKKKGTPNEDVDPDVQI